MISSPCMRCPKKKMPKDVCMKNCKKLQEVQDLQVSIKQDIFSYAVDYIEENNLGVSGIEI